MGGAAIGIEMLGLGIGVLAQHLDRADAGQREPVRDIGFEIELRVSFAA